MSNVSRSPTDLVKGVGNYRETRPFINFWDEVWVDSGLFWVVAPLMLWAIVSCTCAVALFYQRFVWISRFAGVGGSDSGHNLQSLPGVLNPRSLWLLAALASFLNIPYYYSVSTLWTNSGTAYNDPQVFILQICASISTAVFILAAAFKSVLNLNECMNYRDSAHKAPEPDGIKSPKKHLSHQELLSRRSVWKEDTSSSELAAGSLALTAPAGGSGSFVHSTHHREATRKEIVSGQGSLCV
jgi:hypothetical protein